MLIIVTKDSFLNANNYFSPCCIVEFTRKGSNGTK